MPKKLLISISLAFICSCSSNGSNEEPQQPSSSSVAETPSSSSLVQSSSSSVVQTIKCTEEYNPATHFCDTRDGYLYKIVKIGTQTWFAENLNYNLNGSMCYDNLPSNCNIYGRLYDWATAMALDQECNKIDCSSRVTSMQQGVCPEGWHIASQEDWVALESSAYEDHSFYALGGSCLETSCNDYAGVRGYYWSSEASSGWFMVPGKAYSFPSASWDSIFRKLIMKSVRCVQGERKSYRVNFDTNGGEPATIPYSALDSGLTYWGHKYPENPVKIGYTFGGWFDDSDMRYTTITPITKDVSLKAKWNELGKGEIGEVLNDSRDNQSYPTVILNGKRWMAKNLNFNASGSMCYGDSQPNCEIYGRLYTWDVANTACPSGWHLPTDEEWENLIEFAGGYIFAGRVLKSSDWDGSDDFNFSALPGGCRIVATFVSIGFDGLWWTSSEFRDSPIFYGVKSSRHSMVSNADEFAEYSLSVRCVDGE